MNKGLRHELDKKYQQAEKEKEELERILT